MQNRSNAARVAIIFIAASCWIPEKARTQIGPFNLNDSLITESQFISLYGKGCTESKARDSSIAKKVHLYYDSESKVWIEVRIAGDRYGKHNRFVQSIMVTKNKLCSKACEPNVRFGTLATKKGIQIGDSIKKVEQAYGSPTVSFDVGTGTTFSAVGHYLKLTKGRVLRYLGTRSDDLFFSEYYFIDGRLNAMLISISE